jgi:arginine:pyruvate transaminase
MTAQAVAGAPDLASAMAARMARRAGIIHTALDNVAGLHVHKPEAGMFALVDIRALSQDSQAFALALLKAEAVAVMPGASFGKAFESWLRLALNASDDATQEACTRIKRFAMGWPR